MRVILLRHGRAGDPDPDRWADDKDRPLTEDGVQRLQKSAKGLAKADKPERVFASPATRTQQTAQVMQQHADWPEAEEAKFLNDGTEPRKVTKRLNKLHEHGVKSVALVGHEPQLSALASYWLAAQPFNDGSKLKKGAAAAIDYHPQPGGSRLEWMMPAKALAKLSTLDKFSA